MSTFHYDPPREPFLDILFEDEHIVVVNKPSGILSVPGKAVEHFDSIASRVKSLYPQGGAVHRLDMGTSGVMVISHTWSRRNSGKSCSHPSGSRPCYGT